MQGLEGDHQDCRRDQDRRQQRRMRWVGMRGKEMGEPAHGADGHQREREECTEQLTADGPDGHARYPVANLDLP